MHWKLHWISNGMEAAFCPKQKRDPNFFSLFVINNNCLHFDANFAAPMLPTFAQTKDFH